MNRFRVKIFSLGANHGGSFHKRRDTATVSAPLRLGDHRPYSAVIHCAHVTAHESLFLWSGGCPFACLRLVPAYRAVELACGARVNSPEQTVWGGGGLGYLFLSGRCQEHHRGARIGWGPLMGETWERQYSLRVLLA